MTNQHSKQTKQGNKFYNFGDIVFVDSLKGVVVDGWQNQKWAYFSIVLEDCEFTASDFHDKLITYENIREDRIKEKL